MSFSQTEYIVCLLEEEDDVFSVKENLIHRLQSESCLLSVQMIR